MSFSEEMKVRIEKMNKIKSYGIPLYPESFFKKDSIFDILSRKNENFPDVDSVIASSDIDIETAGRVVLFRSFGKLMFAHLQDDTGRIQIMFSRENCRIIQNGNAVAELTGESDTISAFKFAEKLVDLGDFIGVHGTLFRTHKGELTVFVNEFEFLGKAMRPLPEKFHGLADEEAKYRARYLDVITDGSAMERFRFRSDFVRKLREFYWKEGFIEIEGQVLTNAATGAAAKPYVTHQNALDMDVFLRISHEIPLKLMNLAGMDRIFELGKAFRNEWQDPSHLPEHLHLEHNANYWTYRDNMDFTEKMFDYLFDELKLERKRKILNKEGELIDVDFTTPWAKVDYIEMVKKDTGIDVSVYSDVEKLRSDIRAQGIEIDGMDAMGLTTLIDYLYKKKSRPKIINPTFLYNYPVVLKPFARRNNKNPDQADAFQLLINGWELVNSYSELVDPIDQAERFKAGEQACAEWDEEAMTGDTEFVRAMEHGMPPISGWGMGVDRIIALLTEQNNLRDVVLFPLMRPKNEDSSPTKKSSLKIATIMINREAAMEPWKIVNTASHLAAAFAGRSKDDLFMYNSVSTSDGQKISLNIQHAIIIRECPNDGVLKEMIENARTSGLEVSEFTREMLETSNDKVVREKTEAKEYRSIEHLGILVFGDKEKVESITKDFPLWK